LRGNGKMRLGIKIAEASSGRKKNATGETKLVDLKEKEACKIKSPLEKGRNGKALGPPTAWLQIGGEESVSRQFDKISTAGHKPKNGRNGEVLKKR